MTGTKEADLVMAVLFYALRCLGEGDQLALRAMRFGAKEIEALRQLDLADLYRVGTLRAVCLDITLDHDVYWPMIERLRTARADEEVQRDLVRGDAPAEMMLRLFGVGAREYTRLRQMLAVAPAVGRPPDLDEDAELALWQAWSKRIDPETRAPLAPADYLALHEETGIALRAIWGLTERWREEGEPSTSATVTETAQTPTPKPRPATPA